MLSGYVGNGGYTVDRYYSKPGALKVESVYITLFGLNLSTGRRIFRRGLKYSVAYLKRR
jgi:hypothetical protein